MAVNQKLTGRTMSMPGGLAVGGVCSLLVTCVCAAVIAWLVAEERMPEPAIGYGVMVLLLLASFTGAMAAWGKIKRQRMLVCLLSGAVYFGTLLAITALFFGGQFGAVGVTALMVLCGCALAAMTGLQQGKGGKHRKMKLPHR